MNFCELVKMFENVGFWSKVSMHFNFIFVFYNWNIMNTSLQNIITRQSSSLNDAEVNILFHHKKYPQFQLAQFHKNAQLCKKERFLFFVQILEKWNKEVKDGVCSLSDCLYTKNDFIFSWLKSLAVQDQKHMDGSLQKLFSWYNCAKNTEPVCLLKKEPSSKSKAQEWQIRNSYKSNLPLEIDTYKRRFIINENREKDRYTMSRSVEQQSNESVARQLNSFIRLKKHNSLVKDKREEDEIKDYMNKYRKSKIYFYKNIPKNYYKKEFDRDKLAAISKFIKPTQNTAADEIKNYRIKTTIGFRKFGSNNFFNKTSYVGAKQQGLMENSFIVNQSFENSGKLSNISNVGLMTNTFDSKLKSKKR